MPACLAIHYPNTKFLLTEEALLFHVFNCQIQLNFKDRIKQKSLVHSLEFPAAKTQWNMSCRQAVLTEMDFYSSMQLEHPKTW